MVYLKSDIVWNEVQAGLLLYLNLYLYTDIFVNHKCKPYLFEAVRTKSWNRKRRPKLLAMRAINVWYIKLYSTVERREYEFILEVKYMCDRIWSDWWVCGFWDVNIRLCLQATIALEPIGRGRRSRVMRLLLPNLPSCNCFLLNRYAHDHRNKTALRRQPLLPWCYRN